MIVAMAEDVRVILIKLADRLHNMRTIEYLGKQKQVQKAKETLEVYAPLAHRLGIHAIKWELEDLSLPDAHPRKYERSRRWSPSGATTARSTSRGGDLLRVELEKVDIPAEISAARSTSTPSTRRWRRRAAPFNEIYDLTAMRVIVERSGEEGTRDCYGALGLIHSLWKPMPGRFKDFVAMPKSNRYRSLHTTVIGPEGRRSRSDPARGDARDAELGIAAHWAYKHGQRRPTTQWLRG
jgi:GTP pyrophosphokinase